MEDIPIGEHVAEIKSESDGRIWWIANHDIVKMAREAGTPKDKGAGILFKKKIGDSVKKGDVLMEIYAEKVHKLNAAVKIAKNLDPFGIYDKTQDRMIISKVPAEKESSWLKKRFSVLER